MLHPVWIYAHEGFNPTPPHPFPGPARTGPGGVGGGIGWGGMGGIHFGFIFILHVGYCISICIHVCNTYTYFNV